ncbi:MAG: lysophospholipid acyltransferase family protein [Acholeplasmataceae bacterium]|nr:1-acyl-sn-glycerol-3-phosphate acyltransferase [Acholeplasmataceae bacterium]
MRLREELGRLGLRIVFYPKFKFKFAYHNFDPKRKEPYFLVGNHASLYDPLYVGMNLKHYPYPVAANLLYTQPLMRFALTKIVTSIPKRKGQSDIQTIRSILKAFKEDKRGIMIFPEGNSSYFGEETPTDFQSTAKLVKKVGEDLVYARISGGYLASPRWGKFRKKGHFQIDYELLMSKEQIIEASLEQIEQVLSDAIKFNDYDWNRKEKIIYRSNQKAIGLESYLYYCPICHHSQTIETDKNDIYCHECGKIATINDYEFLEGLPFDNLVAWDHLQKEALRNILKEPVYSSGELLEIDFKKNKRISLGLSKLELIHQSLHIKTKNVEFSFPVKEIEGIVLTQKQYISFDVNNITYLLKLKDCKLFLDAITYLKENN